MENVESYPCFLSWGNSLTGPSSDLDWFKGYIVVMLLTGMIFGAFFYENVLRGIELKGLYASGFGPFCSLYVMTNQAC